jgi:subtilisin
MKRLVAFLIAGLLLSAFSVSTVLAQNGNLPWGVERIRGDLAGNGQGIRVAVIDTGIVNHPDLDGRVVDGISFVEGKQYWEDDNGHGTHVAGTIAAIDNGDHLIGVAPKVDLYAIKVDPIDITDVVYGIYWAVDQGVHVISMSLGYTENNTDLKQACDYAYSQGVLLIAASGNSADPKWNTQLDMNLLLQLEQLIKMIINGFGQITVFQNWSLRLQV